MRRNRESERADNLKVGTEVIGTQRVVIRLSGGDFHAEIGNDHFREDTYEKLLIKLKATERKLRVKINIPITRLDVQFHKSQFSRGSWISGHGVRHLTITGVNARTGKLLARADDGEAVQIDRQNYDDQHVKRLKPEQVTTWLALSSAKRAADKALDKFLKTVKIDDLGELVDQAVAAAVDDPHEVPEPDADPRVDPALDHACPTCDAPPGMVCRDKASGHNTLMSHTRRIQRAAREKRKRP